MALFLDARACGPVTVILALLVSAAVSSSTAGAEDLKRAPRERVVEQIEAPSGRSYEDIITQLPPLIRRKAAAKVPAVTNAKQGESEPAKPAASPPSTPISPESVAKDRESPSSSAPAQQSGGEAPVSKDANAAAPPAPSVATPVPADAQSAPAPEPQAASPMEERPAVAPEQPAAISARPDLPPEANAGAASKQAPQTGPPAPLPETAESAASAPVAEQPPPGVGAAGVDRGAPAPVAQPEKPSQNEPAHPAGEGAGKRAVLVRLAAGLAVIGILIFWLRRRKAGAEVPEVAIDKKAVVAGENPVGAKAPLWTRALADVQAGFHRGARAKGGVAPSARVNPAGDGASNAANLRAMLGRSPVGRDAPISAVDADAARANAREIERWLSGGSETVELLEPKQSGATAVVAKTRRSLRDART